MDLELYNSYLEIDFRKMKRSMDTVLAAIGPNKGIIPVVKADAYGQGITKIVEFLVKNYGIKAVACARCCAGGWGGSFPGCVGWQARGGMGCCGSFPFPEGISGGGKPLPPGEVAAVRLTERVYRWCASHK